LEFNSLLPPNNVEIYNSPQTQKSRRKALRYIVDKFEQTGIGTSLALRNLTKKSRFSKRKSDQGFSVNIPTRMLIYSGLIFIVVPLVIGSLVVIKRILFGIAADDHYHPDVLQKAKWKKVHTISKYKGEDISHAIIEESFNTSLTEIDHASTGDMDHVHNLRTVSTDFDHESSKSKFDGTKPNIDTPSNAKIFNENSNIYHEEKEFIDNQHSNDQNTDDGSIVRSKDIKFHHEEKIVDNAIHALHHTTHSHHQNALNTSSIITSIPEDRHSFNDGTSSHNYHSGIEDEDRNGVTYHKTESGEGYILHKSNFEDSLEIHNLPAKSNKKRKKHKKKGNL